MSPAPNRYHQQISGNLEFILRKYLETNPTGVLYHAPFDVVLNEVNVFQPDIVFVSNERKFVLTDQGVEGSPDLVIEILSDRTARIDKNIKKKIFANTGVEELWIIDPIKQSIEIYFLQKNAEHPSAVHKVNAVFASPTFPNLKIKSAEVFKP